MNTAETDNDGAEAANQSFIYIPLLMKALTELNFYCSPRVDV